MSTVVQLCESREIPYSSLMEAVEEFVDSIQECATIEVYQATAKRLLGETLTHDEIMLDAPFCTPADLIVLERAPSVGDVKFHVGTDTQIRTMLTKLKLGRKGLNQLYQSYQDMISRDNTSPDHTMAKVARLYNLDIKSTQIILTKLVANKGVRKEHYMQMAEEVLLIEETPTNTAGGGMPDHEPSDGKSTSGKPKRRKKLEDVLKK